MSGGVDSSVAVALLQKVGWKPVGVTMQLDADHTAQNIKDAQKVAQQLSIQHFILDLSDTFRKEVIDYFVNEYTQGRTPNPCVICNQKLKFGRLLEEAQEMGIDYIATGHYAQISKNAERRYQLKKAKDLSKDQSYFLYRLSQDQLKNAIFPLGNLEKTNVRKIASELGLTVAEKKESQEICFIKDNDYKSFIEKESRIKNQLGDFLDINGNKIGEHEGIFKYTIGQRKGLKISAPKPYFVTSINIKDNTITLGQDTDTYSSKCFALDVNWVSIEKQLKPFEAQARVRYTATEQSAIITPTDQDKLQIEFKKPQRAITPGQSIVLYNQNTVLAGGIISML